MWANAPRSERLEALPLLSLSLSAMGVVVVSSWLAALVVEESGVVAGVGMTFGALWGGWLGAGSWWDIACMTVAWVVVAVARNAS